MGDTKPFNKKKNMGDTNLNHVGGNRTSQLERLERASTACFRFCKRYQTEGVVQTHLKQLWLPQNKTKTFYSAGIEDINIKN